MKIALVLLLFVALCCVCSDAYYRLKVIRYKEPEPDHFVNNYQSYQDYQLQYRHEPNRYQTYYSNYRSGDDDLDMNLVDIDEMDAFNMPTGGWK